MSTRSPKPFLSFFASSTMSPRRGPGGIWISSKSSLRVRSASVAISSYRARRAFDFAWRPFALRAHPVELVGESLGELRVLLALDGEALLLLLEVGRVVALVGVEATAVDLADPLGHVVEEVPVVGHGEHGAGVLGEVLLEPEHALGVEVVGGLVEEQQVGLLQQELAERDAALLTAGEHRHLLVAGRAAQRIHRLVELRVEVPRVGRVDGLLQGAHLGEERVEVGVGLGHRERDLVEPVELRLDRADALLHVLEHGLRSRRAPAPASGCRRSSRG